MSAWKEWKNSQVKAWHLLSPKTEYLNEKEFNDRYDICKSCTEFINLTKQCSQCGCFMAAKTRLNNAVCPLGKW